MFEKVNPSHPDKIADRIAGALVDCAYKLHVNPKIAVEVLIGHGTYLVIIESSVHFSDDVVRNIVRRISGVPDIDGVLVQVPQDGHLAANQSEGIRCGDNGIFKGCPLKGDEFNLTQIAKRIYDEYPYDGKYVIDHNKLVICQSNTDGAKLGDMWPGAVINPLGEWTGGIDVDSGATNRKLGSDMGRSATGGGLHGKDLSKADVSVNIYAWLKAQSSGETVELTCAIGDEYVDGRPYGEIVEIARSYISDLGGFEKFAEWGLIR